MSWLDRPCWACSLSFSFAPKWCEEIWGTSDSASVCGHSAEKLYPKGRDKGNSVTWLLGMASSSRTLRLSVMETIAHDSGAQGSAVWEGVWLCLCLNSLRTAKQLSSCEVYQALRGFWT